MNADDFEDDRYPWEGNSEQAPWGFITLTVLENGGVIVYGPFADEDSAMDFGSKLINATIQAIYTPSLH